jgi:hypothetical protein
MKTAEMMLKMVSATGNVVTGVATGGTSASLTDSNLNRSAGEFTGGTIIFLSGDLDNTWASITEHLGTEISFPTQSKAVVAGVNYALIPAIFSADRLLQAIKMSLAEWGQLLACDKTLTADTNISTYTLPTGVADVRRVDILDGEGIPRHNYYWEEQAGYLIFSKAPTNSNAMHIYYVGEHPEVSTTVDIDPKIDVARLLHSSLSYLYGMIVAFHGKDYPIYVELLNRETQLAQKAAQLDTKQNYRTPQRDPHLGW